MRGKSTAKTHEQYLASLAEPRRAELRTPHELIRATVPELAPTM
ncbi:hypothetical protein [Amycolatopsis anabasis]|nr:hypothetical protein [Amycolatopsis anabasis]